jgi:Thioredoxin-like
MYTFKHDPEFQYIYFDKNDSLMVRLNTSEFDTSLTFCGRGDEKNNFLIELFLKNQSDKNSSFDIYDNDFKSFSVAIEKDYKSSKDFYERRKKEIDWNCNFDVYAKSMLDMHYFSKKEMFPVVHKTRTGEDISKKIPSDYYDFRKDIDLNNESLTSFSPFVRYLTSMLNNVSYTNFLSTQSNTDIELKKNIKKLEIADSLFTNKKIKNSLLNNIAFMYLLEDQNMKNNKSFLDKYLKLSSDSEKQSEIKKIGESIQMLSPGNILPYVDLVDKQNKKVNLKTLFNKKTVVFFWTTDAKSHLEAVHQKSIELQTKYPSWNFVSINIDDTEKQWHDLLSKYDFKNTIELHATNFRDIKDKWVITKIHRSMILNADQTIKDGFVNLFDVNFSQNLN